MAGPPPGTESDSGEDRSVRVSVPEALAEEAGAVLMDVLGSFEEEQPGHEGRAKVTLVFYPPAESPSTRDELLPLLPAAFADPGVVDVETGNVSRDWVEGWREHFRPVLIGAVRIRPPWEPPLETPASDAGAPGQTGAPGRTEAPSDLGSLDVVINPGLGFGTGLHPTTRGTLLLLQEGIRNGAARGRLADVGTGSGILAIAAAKLGWAPVVALDNDPVALVSARENVVANGVQRDVDIHETDIGGADETWFRDATVLANMTLEPVTLLLRRLAGATGRPRRLVVSGILVGGQEEQLALTARQSGFAAGRRLNEGGWVSLELLPCRPAG